jgi:GTPase SAR1 family protein
MLVFDVTSAATLASAQKWLVKARAARPGLQGVLVGNKIDLAARRAVSAEEAQAFVASNKLLAYFETSAVRLSTRSDSRVLTQ